MLQEFKDFINRGNVLDLAVAVVLGVAFAAVVGVFVNEILLALIGAIFGEPGFDALNFEVNDVTIGLGTFINAVINFVIVAFAIFMLVRGVNKLQKKPAPPDPTTKECPLCLSTIPIKAIRCAHCTSELRAV